MNDNLNECWKPIAGYEGKYEVSNLGRVKSLQGRTERILKAERITSGYMAVHLYKGGERKCCTLQRLVGKAFLPNPDNLPEINHIDEDKSNNAASNLEWCSKAYNIYYSHAKSVDQLTKEGELVKRFPSLKEAAEETAVNINSICSACQGRYKTAGKFKWRYAS